jgi:hypothetical protein
LTATGGFAQTVNGKIEFEISGTALNQIGDLLVGGPTLLDGTAAVRLVGGFTPAIGDAFDVISSSGGFGGTRFDSNLAEDSAGTKVWGLIYTGTRVSVQLLAARSGDLNRDGLLSVGDWTEFIAGAYADLSGLNPVDAYARGDLNNDGMNDFYDFSLFKQAYNQANGFGAFERMLAGVPEPGTASLVVVALVLGAGAKRRGRPGVVPRGRARLLPS